jgi:hypothetical protein
MALAELEEIIQKTPAPSWFQKLQDRGYVPPPPPDGWGKWWESYGGYVWLLIIAAGLQLAVTVADARARRVT